MVPQTGYLMDGAWGEGRTAPFPVSHPKGAYRRETGNGRSRGLRRDEAVAAEVLCDDALADEFGERLANGGRAHAAVLADASDRGGLPDLVEGLPDARERRGLGGGGIALGAGGHRERQRRTGLGQLQRDVVLRGRGAVLGGEGELRAPAAHIEIRVTPYAGSGIGGAMPGP